MNLFKASNQWANRPNDERFASVQELRDATYGYVYRGAFTDTPSKEDRIAYEWPLETRDLRVEAQDKEIVLVGKKNVPARLTNWSFGQLCNRVEAPSNYLRSLPPTLACQLLNHGLAKRAKESPEEKTLVLMHKNGSMLLRAMTSEIYGRIWNYQIANWLMQLAENHGWRVPPARPAREDQPGVRPATEADVLRSSYIQVGELIAPAGLYASDHDLFAFMVNDERRIDDGTEDGLSRGFFVTNSEVGAAKFKITMFYHRGVCGNHIVWGASDIFEIGFRHVGDMIVQKSRRALVDAIGKAADASAREDEQKIKAARELKLAENRDELVETVFKKRIPGLTQKALTAGYDANIPDVDGSPLTVWGLVQGLTRYSQSIQYADQRDMVDRAAGKLLTMAF